MNRRILIVIVLAAALLGGILLMMLPKPMQPVAAGGGAGTAVVATTGQAEIDAAPAAEEAGTVAAPASASVVAATPAAAAAAISAAANPLPPLDAPLADVIDTLRERAQRGDARAACRLAAELRSCEMVDVQLEFARRMEAMRQQNGGGRRGGPGMPERMQNFADRQVESALAMSEHCAGVPPTPPSEQIRYWRQAALQGHLPSMGMYASGEAFRPRNSLALLKELETFRTEAEAMARRAALAGDQNALLALSAAYAPQIDQPFPSLLAQAVNPDPVEELAMLLLAQKRGVTLERARDRRQPRSLQDTIDEARQRIDPERAARAEALATERFATQPPGAVRSDDTRYIGDAPWGGADNSDRRRCDADAFLPVAAARSSG